MYLFSLELVYVLVVTAVLVRTLLTQSSFTTLVAVCLTVGLSFVFFESFYAFFPLVSYLLKDYILSFFTWLKAVFLHLKEKLLFDNKEEQKESIVSMKGKEEPSFVPEERDNSGNVPVQSSNPQNTSSVQAKDGQVTISFPAPNEKILAMILSSTPNLIDYSLNAAYLVAFLRWCVGGTLELYNTHGHTIEGRRFADRRVATIAPFTLLFVTVTKSSGNVLADLGKKVLEPLLRASNPIERSPENQDRLKELDQKLAGVLTSQVYVASTLSGDFLEVSGDKATEFIYICLKAFNELLKDGKIDINLNGLENLERDQLVCLINGYNALPQEEKLFIKEHCDKSYPKMVEIDKLLGDLASLDLVNINERESSLSPEQGDVPIGPKPPMAPIRTVQFGELTHPEHPTLTVTQSVEQEGDNISPLSSYASFSTTFGPRDYERGVIKQREEQVERVEGLRRDFPRLNFNTPSTSELEVPQGNSSSLADQCNSPGRSPGSRHEPLGIFSNLEDTNTPTQHNSSETQLAPKEGSLSLNSDDFGSSPSALEDLEKGRYLQWIACGFCGATLLTTNQIALAVLRNLHYTQNLVKKLTDKGIPKFLLLWIYHPNPKWVGEKPLSRLMVGVLTGNFIVLYLLMRMIYLLS